MKLFKKFKKEIDNKDTSIDIQDAFKLNLKYIADTCKDVNVIRNQFVKTNTRYFLTVGEINCPTGRIVVSDPLAYLVAERFSPVLENQVLIGKYPVEVSICRSDLIGIRMCTVKMKIKPSVAIRYELAKSTQESAVAKGKDGIINGFPVDAGMVCICDEKVAKEYQSFINEWYKQNPDGNHYDDYFSHFFKQSALALPQYQREEGDFIEWANPYTKNRMVMVASGLGDGFYQSYWGYDKHSEICELIIPMVNPDFFGV